jgi:hypothetical protein
VGLDLKRKVYEQIFSCIVALVEKGGIGKITLRKKNVIFSI